MPGVLSYFPCMFTVWWTLALQSLSGSDFLHAFQAQLQRIIEAIVGRQPVVTVYALFLKKTLRKEVKTSRHGPRCLI